LVSEFFNGGFLTHGGDPAKWMVYNGKSMENPMFFTLHKKKQLIHHD
jgi:hypothetical protein